MDPAVKRIHDREVDFCSNFNALDFEGAASCYRVEGVLMPPGIDAVNGRDKIAIFLQSFHTSGSVKVQCDPIDVHRLSEEKVFHYGHPLFHSFC